MQDTLAMIFIRLFVGAENSLRSVQNQLPESFQVNHLSVYSSSEKIVPSIPQADIVILTSPLNAQAWHRQYTGQPPQQLIAIGHTTAKALTALNYQEILLPQEPSEAAIFSLIQNTRLHP